LDLREILLIEELLFHIRISDKYVLASFSELEYALSTIRMLIKTANQGLSYIERHCRESGLKMDLHALDTRRTSSFADTHPYDVLLPYARIDGLLGDFETYDQYRGYEYFIPGYESKEARHLPCERDKIDR
jgi:hypothetical protein